MSDKPNVIGRTMDGVLKSRDIRVEWARCALDLWTPSLAKVISGESAPTRELIARFERVFAVSLYPLAWAIFGEIEKLPMHLHESVQALADGYEIRNAAEVKAVRTAVYLNNDEP